MNYCNLCVYSVQNVVRTERLSGVEVHFTVAGGSRQRVRFESRADGAGWWRFQDEWTGCTWRAVGRESVTDIKVLAAVRTEGADD